MPSSKELSPSTTPFFPNQFIKNQYCTKPQYIDPTTSLSNKVAIVTGSNTGLGYECANQLLSFNLSRLILAVRSESKGLSAAKILRGKYPEATIEVWRLDMISYDSVREFVQRVENELPRLDIAILNSGISGGVFNKLPTGHDEAVQVNYYSTVLLAILLLPILKTRSAEGAPGRLTIVTTMLSLIAKFAHKDQIPLLPSFDKEEFYDKMDIYPSSKFLAQMFLWKLVDLVSAEDVIVNMVEPGFAKGTQLHRYASAPAKVFLSVLKTVSARSVQLAATTYLDAVITKGKESHGCLLMNWEIIPFVGLMYTEQGREITDRLWQETIEEFKFVDATGILESL